MENTWKNTLWRAARTFCQAALAYLMTALAGGLAGYFDAEGRVIKAAVAGLIVSTLSAGIAALMNLPEKDGADGIAIIGDPAIVKRADESIEEIPPAAYDDFTGGGGNA